MCYRHTCNSCAVKVQIFLINTHIPVVCTNRLEARLKSAL